MADNEIRVPCDLDKESVEFLETKLGAKINPHLETEKDYNRAIFYFKCCGLQEEAGLPNPDKQDFAIRDCFFSKEKADLLFENVYQHALDFQKISDQVMNAAMTGDMPSPEDMAELEKITMSGLAAQAATTNETLSPALHIFNGTTETGNAQLLTTVSLEQFSGYLTAFPDLQKDLGEKYSAVVTQAAYDIASFLPKDADKEAYLPVIKEHPKAVLALAITAQSNKEANLPTTISSPEDLLKKCQSPTITALSSKISFNDLDNSVKEMYTNAQPVIGLGKEQAKISTVSRAKVNEG